MSVRTFKFRVWDNVDKRFLETPNGLDFYLKRENQVPTSILIKLNLLFHSTALFTVQQFTGEKDKNGKEIYEGDIMDTNGVSTSHGLHEVCFFRGSFSPVYETGIIIGNIFQNPELIS